MSSSGRRHRPKPSPIPAPAASTTISVLDPPTDCLYKCQSEDHAGLVLRCAGTGNLELFKHCASLCSNPWNIRDSLGRNALMVAASCGHLDIVLWLLKRKGRVKIELTDYESRWSALHRAAYYGHVGLLIPLRAHGGNLDQLDHDKYTPLNILQYTNRQSEDKTLLSSKAYLYVWGANTNMTLGHDHVRDSPELLQLPRDYGDIKQAVICKFHSVFLTQNGRVYTCGHGQGGRLGHGNDKTCISPKLVHSLKNDVCIEVAAARNHTVFLSNKGIVYSSGLNDAHQLGQTPKNSSVTLPHSLTPYYLRSLKGVHIQSIGAGRYHTAMCTEREIYTCGKNMGQLGLDKSTTSQIPPKLVTGIYIDKDDSIANFSASDAATACITRKKRIIYVCANYRVLRCDRVSIPENVSIVQFIVCASLGELQSKQKRKGQNSVTPTSTQSGCGLTIGLTDSSNQLWMSHWEDLSKKSFTSPQLVYGSTKRNVVHFSISKHLTVVTSQGEVFTGPLLTSSMPPSLLALKRIPNIQQAAKVFTDYKANNMAVIQTVYCPPNLPSLERSSFSEDIYGLLTEDVLRGTVHDVTFNVVGKSIKANKLILSSQSSVFSSLFKSSNKLTSNLISSYDEDTSTVTLCVKSNKIFELFLQYIYGGELTIISSSSSPPKPSVNNDSPPSTSNSKTSLDDSSDDINTWTSLYDKHGYSRQNSYDILNEVDEYCPQLSGGSPPPTVRQSSVSNPIIVLPGAVISYETDNMKEDLALLKDIASGFKVNELAKRLDSVSCSHSATKSHSCSIKGPQIIVNPDSVPHDVVIISETGKHHYCHKSMLVTRSDYFQSMLMMGWRETTDSEETELKLPISDSLVELLIQYLYTDHAPLVQDSPSLDWLVSALIMADQLLLKRLKTLCEQSLANMLSLDNIGDVIELSEVYNADQLQTSCVEFVCLNLTALLESGGVEGVSPQILDRISNTYKEMHPIISSRRPFTLKELTMGEVPSGYLSNEVIESSDDENVLPRTPSVTTPTYRAKSPMDTPTSGSKTTPTGSSNSARKKRRKKGKPADTLRQQLTFEENDKKINHRNKLDTKPVDTIEEGGITSKENKGTDSQNYIETDDQPSSVITAEDSTSTEVIKSSRSRDMNQPWGDTNSTDSVDFRSIMSTEEQRVTVKNIQPLHNKVNITKAIAIPKNGSDDKGAEFKRSMSLPESMRSPTSPWGSNNSSTKVSFKSLMAAEEMESEKRSTKEKTRPTQSRAQQISATSVHQHEPKMVKRDRRTSFPPLHSNVASFSDIVSSQQQELDCQLHKLSHKKQFHLIQIEEQAIHGLMSLYNAHDNPNEFISVERVAVDLFKTGQHKRTSAPPRTVISSAWAKKL